MEKKRNVFIRIFRQIFFKKVKVGSDRHDMRIPSYLSQPIGGNSETGQIINWVVSVPIGVVTVAVLVLGIIFL